MEKGQNFIQKRNFTNIWQILVFALFVLLPIGSSAVTSDVQQDNNEDYVLIHDGNDYLLILPATTSSSEITNPKLGFSKKYIQKFVGVLEKYSGKAKEWATTAKREGVTDYKKKLTYKRSDVCPKRAYYTVDGQSWYCTYNTGFASTNWTQLEANFYVDKSGQCFFEMSCGIGERKLDVSNKVVVATATANTGVFGTRQVVGQSVVKEIKSIDCGSYYIRIPINQIDSYIQKLKQELPKFDQKKQSDKATDKLFK